MNKIMERPYVIGLDLGGTNAVFGIVDRNANIVAITDSVTSPLAEYADELLIARSDMASIVDSLVADIINPLLGLFGGMNFSEYKLKLLGDATLNYGNFITAIINFLITALVIFCLIKFISFITDKLSKKKEEAPAAPTTKECPYCKSDIDLEATRCPHCTSVLEEK